MVFYSNYFVNGKNKVLKGVFQKNVSIPIVLSMEKKVLKRVFQKCGSIPIVQGNGQWKKV